MDPRKSWEWIAKQIEEHAPTVKGSMSTATRLAEAASALRQGSTTSQVFGLVLPNRDESFEPLYQRALTSLAAWTTVLDPKSTAELSAFMKRLGLPTFTNPTPHRATTGRLTVTLPIVVEDLDADEPTTDQGVLTSFDGARAHGGEHLLDIACMREATCGSSELKGVHENYGWAHGSSAELVYDRALNELRCRLTFDVSRAPVAGGA